jgi:hypothetical protein
MGNAKAAGRAMRQAAPKISTREIAIGTKTIGIEN